MRNWSVRSWSHYIALRMPDPTWILYNHKIQNFFIQSEYYYFVQTPLIPIIWIKTIKIVKLSFKRHFWVKIRNFDSSKSRFHHQIFSFQKRLKMNKNGISVALIVDIVLQSFLFQIHLNSVQYLLRFHLI